MKVEYSSNNSGGSFWLCDGDWYALERAGWNVEWCRDKNYVTPPKDGRWLGTLATGATREGLTLRDAIEEFESVTGQYANALGCNCCGPPHYFTFEGDNGEYDSYSPEYPMYGEPY